MLFLITMSSTLSAMGSLSISSISALDILTFLSLSGISISIIHPGSCISSSLGVSCLITRISISHCSGPPFQIEPTSLVAANSWGNRIFCASCFENLSISILLLDKTLLPWVRSEFYQFSSLFPFSFFPSRDDYWFYQEMAWAKDQTGVFKQ